MNDRPRPLVEIRDPEGLVLTTQYQYYSVSSQPLRHRRMRSATRPDGSWTAWDYDLEGRKTVELRPWLDAPATAPNNVSGAIHQGDATLYDYTPHTPGDTPAINDHRPRTVTRQILGQVVSRTFHVYGVDPNTGARYEITERAHSPAATYGDPDNLTTRVDYFGPAAPGWKQGRVQSRANPDGTLTTHDFELGTWDDATKVFTPSQQNPITPSPHHHLRTTTTQGTTASPDGIAHKTTRTVRIQNPVGNTIRTETRLYTGADYVLLSWENREHDIHGQPTRTENHLGQITEMVKRASCCGADEVTGADGITHKTTRDTFDRVTERRKVVPDGPDLITEYTLDPAGNVLAETRTSLPNPQSEIPNPQSLSLTTFHAYDGAGRRLSTTAPTGATTTTEHDDLNRTTTVTHPDGSVTITERYLDGRTKLVHGTATPTRVYEHGVNPDGSQWTQVTTGDTWQKTTTNMLGQTVEQRQPGHNNTELVTTMVYNSKGQLEKTTPPAGASTHYEYNDLGQQIRAWQDVNGNGTLDLAGPDRVTETETLHEQHPSDPSAQPDPSDPWWRVTRSHTYDHGSDQPTLLSTSKQRLTGLGVEVPGKGLLVSESRSIDIHGNTTVSRRYTDRDTQTVRTEQESPFSDTNATTLTVGGLLLEQTDTHGITTTHDYDELQRRVGTTDPRTGRSFVTYHPTTGLVIKHTDAAGNETLFGHDDTGRQNAVTDPEGNTTHTAYTLRGQVAAQWGATYPVVYEYDDQGRMIHLHTLRDPNHTFEPDVNPAGILTSDLSTLTSQMDTTTWVYEEATGLLLEKLYADGKGPAYTYTPDGRLHTRKWARNSDDSLDDPILASPPLIADAHAHSGNPNTNYGAANQLEVKENVGTNWDREAFLKFDLAALPAHETITGGTLTFRVTGVGGENTVNRPIRLLKVADNAWAENTLTWNNKPATGDIIDEVVVTAATVGQDIAFDLGNHLADHDGSELTLALVQPAGTDGLVYLGSRESDHPPVLELELSPVRLTTTYTYDEQTLELTKIEYSDDTPAVTNEYDRLGRLTQTTDAFGTKTYSYNDQFQLHVETWNGLTNATLTRDYDPQGRPNGFSLNGGYQVTHAHTPTGRISSVTSSNTQNPSPHHPITATYSYTPNSHLLSGYTLGDLTRSVSFENERNLVDTVANTWDTTLISQFDYTNDKAGRRTDREDSGSAFASTQNNTFDYNDRSEVIEATMRNGLSTYNFDQIGNRTSVTTPDEPGPVTYVPNALNQYLSITPDGAAAIEPEFDDDGNLVDDGKGTTFEWNAENRMCYRPRYHRTRFPN